MSGPIFFKCSKCGHEMYIFDREPFKCPSCGEEYNVIKTIRTKLED